MESEKDIEILKHALDFKLELFNEIRFGYLESEEVVNQVEKSDDLLANIIEEEIEVRDEASVSISNDMDNEEEEVIRRVPVNKFGTSYFGRRRR
ncbi:hypothetical protein SY27_06635 [Flavobacterium sp. 316]|uniref:Uncharacterized protein n=1 Tax=Flavobacterium sediminilitoris TaxID=2024526 RepID=A0ABY4HPI4_9FLAO|nr:MULTISPECIES: hypothetical protein [Flavobacterium]KIX21387.1 hypothetical protein SY27_06635 [Flavobacterium sp. 316]UOX34126.1 hypothetical protein LXD69_01115 [Flavobacterium sediminilitoris]